MADIKDYNERGKASVLDGAHDLVKRAAELYRSMGITTPPVVCAAFRKEAEMCLAEAEELIALVRKVNP